MSHRRNERKYKEKVYQKNQRIRRKYSSSSDNEDERRAKKMYLSSSEDNKRIKKGYPSSYNDKKKKKYLSSDDNYSNPSSSENDDLKKQKVQKNNLKSSSHSGSNINKKRTKNIKNDKEIMHGKYKNDIEKKKKIENKKDRNVFIDDSKDRFDLVYKDNNNEKKEFISLELNKSDKNDAEYKEVINSKDTKINEKVLNERTEEKHKYSQEYIKKVENDKKNDYVDEEKKILKKNNTGEKEREKNIDEEKIKDAESGEKKQIEKRRNLIVGKKRDNKSIVEKDLEKSNKKEGHKTREKRKSEEMYMQKLIKKKNEEEENDREKYKENNRKIDIEKEKEEEKKKKKREKYIEREYEKCDKEKKLCINDIEKHKKYSSSSNKYKEKKEIDKIIRNENKNTSNYENEMEKDQQIKNEEKKYTSECDKVIINTTEKKRKRYDSSNDKKKNYIHKSNKSSEDDIKSRKGEINSKSKYSKEDTLKKKKYKNIKDDRKSMKNKSRERNDSKKNYKDKEKNILYMKMNKENVGSSSEYSNSKKKEKLSYIKKEVMSSSSYDLSEICIERKRTNKTDKKMNTNEEKEKKRYKTNYRNKRSLSYEKRSVHIRNSISSRSISSSSNSSVSNKSSYDNSSNVCKTVSSSKRSSNNSRSSSSSASSSSSNSNSSSSSRSSSRRNSNSSSRSNSRRSSNSNSSSRSNSRRSSNSNSSSRNNSRRSSNSNSSSRSNSRRSSNSNSSSRSNDKINYDMSETSYSSDRKIKKNKKRKLMNKVNKRSSGKSNSSNRIESNDSCDIKKKKNNKEKKYEEKEYNPFEEDENGNLEINEDLIEYAKKKIANVTTEDIGKSGGVYIPPFKLERLKNEVTDKKSILYQKQEWMKLKKKINNIVNKVNVDNISEICYELFECNLIRGKGIFSRALIHAQLSSPAFTNVFACLLSIVNSKFPNIGLLTIQRVILHFRRAYKRGDKILCFNTVKFIAHMINQRILHEIVGLQLCSLLLQNITNDSVQVCTYFLVDVGQLYMNICRKGLDIIFDRLKDIIQEGKINIKTQYDIEKLWKYRKNYFSEFPTAIEELDLIDENEKIVHEIDLLDESFSNQEELNIFKEVPYEQFEEENIEWNNISNELLHGVVPDKKGKKKMKKNEPDSYLSDGSSIDSENEDIYKENNEEEDNEEGEEESSSDSEEDNNDEEDTDNDENEEENEKNKEEIKDMTEQYLINLRKNVYLSIMSSLSFEECVHKLLKLNIKKGYEIEICNMLIDCCCMEKTFQKFYALQAERLCKLKKIYQENFEKCFENSYNTAHRLETAKLRNCSKFFAHLLYTDAISWSVFMIIKLTEENTTSSTRIFIKILLQELTNNLGLQILYQKINHPSISPFLGGLFPTDNAQNIRFCINFFTAIGLGALTTSMRKLLLN
ncbi:cell cycle control protein, putative [Plasmodium relictum]|uniref:Cell cycle control protein, putative n=1 Tax=Plasmodium relictum TaxID=85471 RepID=A0A1J1HFI8_PLARL|nr:cell cycle control protein, putative [Plasmodium relictum]CRH02810.1 cell cycle control protein, putative [Plasmodium relictum]